MAWGNRRDRIDTTGVEFVYLQIAEDIETDISSGELPAGARLPATLDLAEIYGVAPATIRRAVAALAERGVLRVQQGRGTYVQRR